MNTVTCPDCGMENAYVEIVNETGSHYMCPDCNYEWSAALTKQEETDIGDIDSDGDTEDDFDIFDQAESYTYMAVNNFIKDIIKEFEKYKITPQQLPIVSKLFKLTSVIGKYEIDGYVRFSSNTERSQSGMQFKEIIFDADGLRLREGGFDNNELGGDSYSATIFPVDNEERALNIVNPVENFFTDFLENLESGEIDIDEIDDGIRKI